MPNSPYLAALTPLAVAQHQYERELIRAMTFALDIQIARDIGEHEIAEKILREFSNDRDLSTPC